MGVAPSDTVTRILDVAEQLVQVCGFNGFSYADIAEAVGVRKASLHHHFESKAALGEALLARYHARFMAALERLDQTEADVPARLSGYVALYRQVLRQDRMCLCGMLAAEMATLPKAMRRRVEAFFAENEAWLARLLEAGRKEGSLGFQQSAADVASYLVSALEGAMLVARSLGRFERFDAATQRLLSELSGTRRARRTGRAGGSRRGPGR